MKLQNIMENLILNKKDFPHLNEYFGKLPKEHQEKILEKIKTMNRDKLYESPIHGEYHSEKVCLFAYLLGYLYHFNDVDMEILTDAAMYHDCMRQNDFEDSFHGMVSANHVEEVLPLKAVYTNSINLLLLKAIIDYHSQPDSRLECNFEIYELPEEEYQRYQLLAKLLKDADGLDRKRFCDKSKASLNIQFLRFEESKKMVALAEEINQAYYAVMEQNQNGEIPLDREIGDCFHSIGFDFFRIESILENGILSFSEMKKKKISFPRNFEGGNSSRWISVVPASLIEKKETAFKTFIQNGIVFLCSLQTLYYPMDYNKKSIAILKGLPFDKSGYMDERYVLLKIEPSAFVSIFVTNEYAVKDVGELSYLYHSLHYETLENRVVYFLNKMGIHSIDSIPGFVNALRRYQFELEKYSKLEVGERSSDADVLVDSLVPILKEINSYIQKCMHRYYAAVLGREEHEKITVAEVMKYELSKLNQEFTIVDGEEEIIFFPEEKFKQKKLH